VSPSVSREARASSSRIDRAMERAGINLCGIISPPLIMNQRSDGKRRDGGARAPLWLHAPQGVGRRISNFAMLK